MIKLPVASHLNEKEYIFLMKAFANHNCSMGIEKKNEYIFSDIVKVIRNTIENSLEVQFKNGDCWHYRKNGTWYKKGTNICSFRF
ncbi:hypothetical protein KM915_21145 [Cytobacillus oceanisediminis]|uniref:hypothetical protein n=1 Tax=Cytobacillus oceanisediminis TaxID=665099 RepID=UPI001C21C969|nr:hypothetical protein [Cytobacillus oceanisediminis]MBU8732559.1 hypothetical protein [Cytobacillus oceanisediminis]